MDIKRCYSCMEPIGEGNFCERCGYDQRKPNATHQLPAGTVLRDQYLIGKVLGQGGFGITYLGWDINLNIPVAIKEYYPTGVVTRENSISTAVNVVTGSEDAGYAENRARFLREAQTLARLEDVPEVVLVKNFFAENNTAYIIMGYVKGITLQEHIRRSGGKLSVEETFRILMPIMEAMDRVHAIDLVHRDISPDNIMIQPGGKPRLIDFGAAHEATQGTVAKSTQAVLKHGYAPMEQYQRKGHLGPWTDVYAMCATVYSCLTGKTPPHATDRMMGEEDFDWNIPGLNAGQIAALKQGTQLQYKDRFQSMTQLRQALLAPIAPQPVPRNPAVYEEGTIALQKEASVPHTAPVEPGPVRHTPPGPYTVPVERESPVQNVTVPVAAHAPAGKSPWKAIVAIALILALLLGVVFVWKSSQDSGESRLSDSDRSGSSRRDEDEDEDAKEPARPAEETGARVESDREMGKVAVFWYSFGDMYLSNVRKSMSEEFEARGIAYMHYDANNSQVTQTSQIETALAGGASVLVVNIVDASSADATQQIVDLAAGADVPVVFFNRSVPEAVVSGSDKAAYVGTDYTMAGRMQGSLVGDYILANFGAVDRNGDGVIAYVMLKGQEGNMEADARTLYSVEVANAILTSAGVSGLEYYDPTSKPRYLVDKNGAWSGAQGRILVDTVLKEGYLVELVIANNDDMAIGAVEALQAAGYNTPGKDYIPVFGIDGTDYAKELIAEGAMMGTIMQDSQGQAIAVVQVAENLGTGRDTFYNVNGDVVGNWRVNIPYLTYTG